MQCAARSSGRVRLKDPRNDFASAVRELLTITASLMPSLSLTDRYLATRKVRERRVRLRELFQQGSRLPEFSVLPAEFAYAVVDVSQPDRIGIPHGPAAICRKTVAVEINNVDVDRAEREAFLENPCAFIDQGINAAVDDLGGRNLTLRNPGLGRPLAYQRSDFGIAHGAPIFIVAIPACRSFLTIAAHLAETIFSNGLAHAGFFEMAVFLADSPTDVETGEVTGGERSHRHAELDECGVDCFDRSAFFHQELRFAAIRTEHSISNKAAAVSDQH